MAEQRLLYFSATRAVLYRWAHGRLAVESSFANNEEGAQAFAAHFRAARRPLLRSRRHRRGGFPPGDVPFVRGADRRTLVGRKLAQRYRDTSLSLALSLGFEKTQRRDERLLLSSFTNNAQFQPWLNVLREKEAAVAGVYSVALHRAAARAKDRPEEGAGAARDAAAGRPAPELRRGREDPLQPPRAAGGGRCRRSESGRRGVRSRDDARLPVPHRDAGGRARRRADRRGADRAARREAAGAGGCAEHAAGQDQGYRARRSRARDRAEGFTRRGPARRCCTCTSWRSRRRPSSTQGRTSASSTACASCAPA